jgi:DNA polymerase III epsilon subunit-like protein
MLVVGFDTETSGLDVKTANILEVGAVLFDVDENFKWNYVEGFSNLIFEEYNFPIPKEASAVNGITEQAIRTGGVSFKEALSKFSDLAMKAEYVVAHNAPYDKSVLENQLIRVQIHSFIPDMKWICSVMDLESNKDKKCWRLAHMALDYGVTVNPTHLHTALADVSLMGEMLSAAKADPRKMWEYKNTPIAVLATPVVPPWDDNGKDRDIAKAAGYGWEEVRSVGKKYSKKWVKGIKHTPENLAKEVREYDILEII